MPTPEWQQKYRDAKEEISSKLNEVICNFETKHGYRIEGKARRYLDEHIYLAVLEIMGEFPR